MHMPFGGEAMSMDSVENLLDIPIDHYVTINMQGMRDLIDAVGGIEVTNKIDFTLEGVHVPKGTITFRWGKPVLPMHACENKIRKETLDVKTAKEKLSLRSLKK